MQNIVNSFYFETVQTLRYNFLPTENQWSADPLLELPQIKQWRVQISHLLLCIRPGSKLAKYTDSISESLHGSLLQGHNIIYKLFVNVRPNPIWRLRLTVVATGVAKEPISHRMVTRHLAATVVVADNSDTASDCDGVHRVAGPSHTYCSRTVYIIGCQFIPRSNQT